MICIYDKAATKSDVLNTNGLAVLDNIALKAEIGEILNGEYDLNAIFLLDVDNNKHSFIVEEAIIKCPDIYGDEVFRINEVTKRSSGREIEVYARHITYDSIDLYIETAAVTAGNGAAFCTALSAATTTAHEFTLSSDLTNTATSSYANMSLHDALFTDQYCFLNVLGGEVSRRQYAIAINGSIGSDNGVKIQSRKNIQGFEIHTNMDGLITRTYPYGDNNLTVTEKYIDSELVSNYAKIRSKKVEFSGITTEQGLRDAVAEMYSVQQVDKLKAEYTVDFIALNKTEEYKNFAVLESIGLGDTVSVYEENFNISISVRVTERTYDVIGGLLASITLSNIAKRSVPTLTRIVDKINEIEQSIPAQIAETHPKLYTGTTAPDPSLGQEGDVYVQY